MMFSAQFQGGTLDGQEKLVPKLHHVLEARHPQQLTMVQLDEGPWDYVRSKVDRYDIKCKVYFEGMLIGAIYWWMDSEFRVEQLIKEANPRKWEWVSYPRFVVGGNYLRWERVPPNELSNEDQKYALMHDSVPIYSDSIKPHKAKKIEPNDPLPSIHLEPWVQSYLEGYLAITNFEKAYPKIAKFTDIKES